MSKGISAITRILRYFSIPFPVFNHFHVMCAIDAATVKRSEAQFRSRRYGIAAPPTPSAPSTSAPSTLVAQLQHMDALLDTLSTELYQVNTLVGRITRRQAHLGGFVESPFPPLKASKTSEDNDNSNNDDDDKDGDASSSDTDKMST